jgi:hypothetical protein
MNLKVVENLQNPKGRPLSTVRVVVLCRGRTFKIRPFCDVMAK